MKDEGDLVWCWNGSQDWEMDPMDILGRERGGSSDEMERKEDLHWLPWTLTQGGRDR